MKQKQCYTRYSNVKRKHFFLSHVHAITATYGENWERKS